MSFQAQLVMVLWIPIVFYLFKRFSVAQAIVTAFLVAWLFLPQKAGFSFSGLPDYERISATCYGIVLCLLIFGSQQKTIWKFNWIDIPIVIYCICPFFSSLSNGLGAYDGASATLGNIVQYGLPYFIGRIYLANTQGLSILTKSILISGLVYVPLCLYEVRMSPQLHRIVYGYHGIRQFAQGIRYGGFRPSVFMRHGLSVGMWMMAVTLIALWLWQSGVVKKIWNIPISIIIFILLVTVILVKSTGAYAYLLYGLIVLFTAKLLRFSFPLVILCLSIWLYLFIASTGQVSQERIDNLNYSLLNIFPEDRVNSLVYRLENEHILVEKALARPIFGWGGWGRNRVLQENSLGIFRDITVTDSLWIIVFGTRGALGLVSVFAVILLPPAYFCYKYPTKLWFKPNIASVAVLSTLLVLYGVDCTLNYQFNPIFIVISGAVSGYLVSEIKSIPKQRKIIKIINAKTIDAKVTK